MRVEGGRFGFGYGWFGVAQGVSGWFRAFAVLAENVGVTAYLRAVTWFVGLGVVQGGLGWFRVLQDGSVWLGLWQRTWLLQFASGL